MSDCDTFGDFLRRIRAGDEQAAAELVHRYEPIIRREVRMHLSDPALCRLLDSMDICQSVLASFFVRAASGGYELEQPGQLLGLLLGMARNKLAFAVRKQRAQRRDGRRLAAADVGEFDPADQGPSPSRVVAGQELLGAVRRRLTDDERAVADRRAEGGAWADIAAELGGTPDGRRMQLARAVDRVAQQLGLDEVGHE